MNTLLINELRLKNFKGIKDFTFSPCGKNISVFGENATGKTTLIDAFYWLLFGKDSQGSAAFQLKPVDDDGHEIHNLETEVKGSLDLNGKTITLKKRFYEKYTKRHGQASAEFTGHSTDHFIDGVPAKKKEYDNKIAEIIDINAFKLVTNPMEFNLLHWTGRRQILLEMCGDVTDQDVIGSDKDLKQLSEILGDHSVDDYKKIIKAKKSEVNKELESIPIRISENIESCKDAEKPDKKEKAILEKELESKKEALRSLVSNEALSAKRVRLNEINSEIIMAQSAADKKAREAKEPLQNTIDRLKGDRRDHVNKIADLESKIAQDEKRNKISTESIEKVRENWFSEDSKKPSGDNTCPTCGQDLPEDQIKSTIETFNRLKADRLERITQEGKTLKTAIADREKAIKEAETTIDSLRKIVVGIDQAIEIKMKDLEKIYVPVNVDKLDKEKDILETEIAGLQNGSKVQEETAQRHIFEAQEKLDAWMQQEAVWKASEKSRARVAELEAQEKELTAEFERLEHELFLIEKFIVKKVELMEGEINKQFNLARFKLFNTQVNGGIDECCETIYNGVPYNSGLNNAARINVGLDIISTLSDFYGFRAPIFIDNSESINELIQMDAQVISLFVSKDKELTVLETEAVKAS